jgi:pimeloyl-ACP methyl ester carboxylesterase
MGTSARVRKSASGDQVHSADLPLAASERIEIRTQDGASLAATVQEPPGVLRGTIVMAHGTFSQRAQWERPRRNGPLELFARAGYRAVAFDFRGHGESATPRGRGAIYDDFVLHDLPAVVETCRARMDGEPLFVVGHSLGGHVAVAALGTKQIRADGLLLCATHLYLPQIESQILRGVVTRSLALTLRACLAARELPERLRKRKGPGYLRDLCGTTGGTWASRDGAHDYWTCMAQIQVPVAAIVSEGDWVCPPDLGRRFAERCGTRVHTTILRHPAPNERPRAPSHQALPGDAETRSALASSLCWLEDAHRG